MLARGAVVLLLVPLMAACPKSGLEVDLGVPEAELRVELGGPVEVLTAAAGGLDPTPRGHALNLLVRASTEPAGGEWGPRGVYDPNPWVQRQVVEALAGRLPEAASADALEALVAQDTADPFVRAAAGMALARAGDFDSLPVLSAAWKEQREPWNRAPLAAAALAMGDAEALEPLSKVLRSGDLPMEIDFVLDLAQSGLIELIPALRDGEKVVEEELRLAYAAARVALGDASGEGALRRAIASDEVEQRLEALDYLTRMEQPAATALIKKAKSNESDLVRWYAQLALAARGAGDADRFTAGFADEDLEIRLLAVRFAGEVGRRPELSKREAKTARAVLRDALAVDEPTVREAAMRSLLELGIDGEEEFLRHNLGNEDVTVRVAAAGAMLLSNPG